MTKVFYSKEPIDVGKCLNDEPINQYKEQFTNPFIDNSFVNKIVDNFQKEQMKQSMRKQIERFGVSPQNVFLRFVRNVDGRTIELAEKAIKELVSEYELKIV